MAPDEAGDFGHAVHSASKALQHPADTAKVYVLGLGGVAHCHFLLIPRIEGLGQDVRASLKNWGDKVSDPEAAVLLQQKIRATVI